MTEKSLTLYCLNQPKHAGIMFLGEFVHNHILRNQKVYLMLWQVVAPFSGIDYLI